MIHLENRDYYISQIVMDFDKIGIQVLFVAMTSKLILFQFDTGGTCMYTYITVVNSGFVLVVLQ